MTEGFLGWAEESGFIQTAMGGPLEGLRQRTHMITFVMQMRMEVGLEADLRGGCDVIHVRK